MKNALDTFKQALKQKAGLLSFIGMIAGIIAAFVGASILKGGQLGTAVALIGAVVSIFCGNTFSQIITLIQYEKTRNRK